MPTNCWKIDSPRPTQTMPEMPPVGFFRSRQDGLPSRSRVSRIRLIVISRFFCPSSMLNTRRASGILWLATR